MSPTMTEWREVYPDAVRDERVFEAFVSAGLEPPRQASVDEVGFTGAQQRIVAGLVRKISDQFGKGED